MFLILSLDMKTIHGKQDVGNFVVSYRLLSKLLSIEIHKGFAVVFLHGIEREEIIEADVEFRS